MARSGGARLFRRVGPTEQSGAANSARAQLAAEKIASGGASKAQIIREHFVASQTNHNLSSRMARALK